MPANPPPAPRDTPESVALLPCPFHEWNSPREMVEGGEGFYVQCMTCGATGPCLPSASEARSHWGHRALLARPAPEARWRVKPLNWWERIEGEEWTACHGDNVYTVLRLKDGTFRASIPQRGGLMVGRTLVLGIFATPEEGRACAQADHEGGVLACLEPDPRPAPEAREAALRERMDDETERLIDGLLARGADRIRLVDDFPNDCSLEIPLNDPDTGDALLVASLDVEDSGYAPDLWQLALSVLQHRRALADTAPEGGPAHAD